MNRAKKRSKLDQLNEHSFGRTRYIAGGSLPQHPFWMASEDLPGSVMDNRRCGGGWKEPKRSIWPDDSMVRQEDIITILTKKLVVDNKLIEVGPASKQYGLAPSELLARWTFNEKLGVQLGSQELSMLGFSWFLEEFAPQAICVEGVDRKVSQVVQIQNTDSEIGIAQAYRDAGCLRKRGLADAVVPLVAFSALFSEQELSITIRYGVGKFGPEHQMSKNSFITGRVSSYKPDAVRGIFEMEEEIESGSYNAANGTDTLVELGHRFASRVNGKLIFVRSMFLHKFHPEANWWPLLTEKEED